MGRRPALQIATVVLCVAAAVVSYNLLVTHLTGSRGPAWFESGCSVSGEAGGADCAAVLASPYSYVPPKFPQDAEEEAAGGAVKRYVPAAFLGLLYYGVLGVWFVGVGCPSRDRAWIHLLPLVLIAVGLWYSVHFTYIMFTKLDAWCPWCLVTHVLNVLIAATAVLMWPWRGKKATVEPADTDGSQPATAPALALRAPHPSARLIVITVLAMMLIRFGLGEALAKANMFKTAKEAKQGFDRCMVAVANIKGDVDKLIRNWKLAEKQDFDYGADDSARTSAVSGERVVQAVVFSDFECPSCKRLATFLEEQAQPLFDGGLRIVFRHFPICQECNDRVSRTIHPHACFAATAAEAARLLGGNDAFWRAHDYFFEHQNALKHGKLTAELIAGALGFEADVFRETMQSEEATQRIQQDIDLAKKVQVHGTPTLFVAGRQVDVLARLEVGFWDSLAASYWKSTGKPRPDAARVDTSSAIPGSPGPKGAP